MTGAEIAIISLAAAGAGVAAYSTYQAGRAAETQAKAEAAWHAYNAKVAQREAEAERQAGAFEAQQHARQAKQLLARQRALIGAAGVTPEGSPLLVAEDTAAQLALENAMIRQTVGRRVSKWQSQSILDISKAGAARSAASGYGRAAYTGAGAALLGGAAQVGFMGYDMWGGARSTSGPGTGTFAWSGYGSKPRVRTTGGL